MNRKQRRKAKKAEYRKIRRKTEREAQLIIAKLKGEFDDSIRGKSYLDAAYYYAPYIPLNTLFSSHTSV